MMRIDAYRSCVLILFAIIVGGCIDVEQDMVNGAAEVDATVGSRIGLAPARARNEASAISAEVDRLLGAALTEDAAVKIAVLNGPKVRESYERIGIRGAELIQSGLLSNPVFSGNAKFFSSATEIEIGIAESFLEVFYIPMRQRVAAANLEAAKASVARDVVAMAFDVRRSFVTLTAAMELVEMRRHVLTAAEASAELMEKLHNAGNVTDPQMTAESASAARARIDLATAEAMVPEARERLNVLLGLSGPRVSWTVPARPAEVTVGIDAFDGIENRAVGASLDLAENRAHLRALAESAGLESWEAAIGTGEIGPAIKHETDGKWGAGPDISLMIPLFDQGQARRARAGAMVREALAHHEFLAVEIRAAVRTIRERIIAFGDRATLLKRVLLPLRARLVHETLQNYNAMQIGAFDVIMAKQQEIEAGGEYIEVMREWRLARIDLEELLAGSLNRQRVAEGMPIIHGESSFPTRKGH